MRGLNCVAAFFLCASVLFASPAFAQSELEGKSFDDLIAEAKTAYDAQKFDEAIKYLLAANRAQPNARLLLNVARSYERFGQCVPALVYFRAFVRDRDAEPLLIDQARAALAESNKCPGWNDLMAGRVLVSAQPAGASLTIDGKYIGTLPTEVVGLMEGDHVVVISLEGHDPHQETIRLGPDRDHMVKATLKETVAVADLPDEPIYTPPKKGSAVPIYHYVIAGSVAAVGTTLFIVGLVTDLGLPKNYDKPRQVTGVTQDQFDALTVQRKSAATRAVIFYIVGATLGIGGGAYGAFVTATAEKDQPPRLTLAPEVGPSGVGISLNGTF